MWVVNTLTKIKGHCYKWLANKNKHEKIDIKILEKVLQCVVHLELFFFANVTRAAKRANRMINETRASHFYLAFNVLSIISLCGLNISIRFVLNEEKCDIY